MCMVVLQQMGKYLVYKDKINVQVHVHMQVAMSDHKYSMLHSA